MRIKTGAAMFPNFLQPASSTKPFPVKSRWEKKLIQIQRLWKRKVCSEKTDDGKQKKIRKVISGRHQQAENTSCTLTLASFVSCQTFPFLFSVPVYKTVRHVNQKAFQTSLKQTQEMWDGGKVASVIHSSRVRAAVLMLTLEDSHLTLHCLNKTLEMLSHIKIDMFWSFLKHENQTQRCCKWWSTVKRMTDLCFLFFSCVCRVCSHS